MANRYDCLIQENPHETQGSRLLIDSLHSSTSTNTLDSLQPGHEANAHVPYQKAVLSPPRSVFKETTARTMEGKVIKHIGSANRTKTIIHSTFPRKEKVV